MRKYIVAVISLVSIILSVNIVLAATFSQADLTGTWHMNLLRTGYHSDGTTPQKEWMRVRVMIDSAGVATCVSMSDSTGVAACPGTFDLKFTMNETTGVITQSGYHAANAGTDHMTMTLNKNLAVGTATNGDGPGYSYQMVIAQKVVSGTTYSAADLQSKNFVYHGLVVGDDTFWMYGEGSTGTTGVVTFNSQTDPYGTTTPGVTPLTLSVDNNGVVTIDGYASFQGFLSDDKKTVIGTMSGQNPQGKIYSLMIFQITGQTYPVGTLPAETSVAHILGALYNGTPNNSMYNFWVHATSTVDSSGVMHFSDWVAGMPALTVPTATYTGYLHVNGRINIDGNLTYHGQMSHDGMFTVGTQTLNNQMSLNLYALTVTTKSPPAEKSLYANFTNAGIWKYSGTGTDWTQTTTSNPQLLVTVGSDLYGTFEGLGIWKFNGTDWTQTTTSVPQMIVGSATTLYGAFSGLGIWQWNESAWSQTTASNPQKIVASTSDLYGTFAGLGIWKWNGTDWTQLTTSIPDLLVTSGTKLYGTFAGLGIWLWNGTQWVQATENTPQMIAANSTTLYGTFEGQGIWSWDGASTWMQISTDTPTQMTASGNELYAAFAGVGIRRWDGTAWTLISGNEPVRMVVGE